MPDTETEVASPDAKKSPFVAALEKAFAGDAATSEGKEPEAKAPESTPKKEKQPDKAPDKKDATPRELFNKSKEGEKKTEPETPEPDEFDKIAPPDFKDEKGKKGWDAQKAEGRRWKGEAQTTTAKLKELEAKLSEYEPLKAQLAERDTKLKEYDEIVARARIDEHPDFRREFIDGRAKLISRAQSIITESGGDAKQIETALNLKGKARVDALREAAGELDNFQSGRLGRVIDELTDLDERAQAKRDDAKQSYAKLQEQSKQRDLETAATRTKNRQIEFEQTSQKLREQLEVLTKVDGHDEWNNRADSIVKEAKAFVDEHPNADIEAEILARSIPAYRDLFLQADKKADALEKKVGELEAELKKVHGKSPSLSARRASTSGGDKPGKPFSDKMNAMMNGGE